MYFKRQNLLPLLLSLGFALLCCLGRELLAASRAQTAVLAIPVETAVTWPVEESVSPTRLPTAESWIAERAGQESPYTQPASEPFAETGVPGAASAVPARRPSFGLRAAGLGLLLLGALCGGAALFVRRQQLPAAGPVLELFGLAAIGVFGLPSAGQGLVPALGSFLLLALAALLLRGLAGFVLCRCDLRWLGCHRLALRDPGGYAAPVLACLLLELLSGGVLCFARVLHKPCWPLGLPLFLGAGMSCALLLRYDRAVTALREKIAALSAGQRLSAPSGPLARSERELAGLAAQRDEAVARAVTGERFKVELISNVSHDLRTPLTAILGYAELLQQEPLPEKSAEQVRKLSRKAGQMKDLVEALFELTKVSSGEIAPKRERIDLIRLLEQTAALYEDDLAAAGLALRRHYARDSLLLVSDGTRLHQVFANLLGNAVKYAARGTRLHLTLTAGEAECCVRLTNVANYEMDFSPEQIVQRFARGDKARTSRGSGLGLAIAKTYTESVGGRFHVQIDADQFSAVVELPLRP